MSHKIIQIGYLVPRDDGVLKRFDQIISELTGRGIVSRTGYCSYAISSDLMIYVIDFDTAWYLPQTFHQDIRNAGLDAYVTTAFRVDYRIESGYNFAVDADSTCVVHAKDGYYANYAAPYRIIGASGVDEI